MNRKTTIFATAGTAAILAAAVLAFTTATATSQAAFAANVNIDIVPGAEIKTSDAFSPSSPEVHVGETVTWTNKDTSSHTVTSGSDGKPDGKFGVKADGTPEIIEPNKTQEFKPTTPGDYSYYCALHPAMVGKLTVEPAGVS
ncbi:cupredoxin domain-containing protein [Nitrososphaera viennensis]|uniref:Blue (Type 1) copper domain protein n=2 Tax=Nitrososphaera viennensis TaxID=1034015 RepID=A0A060HU36_9ARCH|nr:cupredoxin domain-containing protein [Nitrososphaera viennensis]AIC16622.1 blue (type 1) copper domain protein [Nitrososphaera viennensis EN76]UVS68549.1 cupredoxin domain-containing protein [Nitrososphaera viennensis]